MIKALFIDAGHGLGPTGTIDNGASGNGTTERKEVVEMANELYARVKADPDFSNIQVFKIGVDSRMMLKDHIKEINQACKDNGWGATDGLVLSIHINSAGSSAARGLESWYSREEGTIDFARALTEQVSAVTGLPIRPRAALDTSENRFGRLGIIDDTIPKGCLFEAGFITNEFDASFFKNENLDDKFAEGMHRAIRVYLSMPAISGPVAPPTFYTDVPDTAWFYKDVKLCLDQGLFVMPSDGQFHPERPVTRAEMAAIVGRHLRKNHNIL